MRICGIICEYNPFHTGHEYQIIKARENADVIVAIMSGSFTQRGEPAFFDKWTRAKAAVSGGVDLVIELPFLGAVAPAENFASAAVKLIGATGIIDTLAFGSESGDLDELAAVSENREEIRIGLKQGESYSKAVATGEKAELFTPNNILAMEYLRAIEKYAPHIKPVTVKRIGDYHSENPSGSFISATACRKAMVDGKLDEIRAYLPDKSFELVKTEMAAGNFSRYERLDSLFIGLLRRDREFLKNIAYVSEGIENRFYKAADRFNSVEAVAEAVKSKRYTRARINRIIANALVGVTKNDITEFYAKKPLYARILAANSAGISLLGEIQLPIITRAGQAAELGCEAKRQWEIECIATDLHAQSLVKGGEGGGDYTHFFEKL